MLARSWLALLPLLGACAEATERSAEAGRESAFDGGPRSEVRSDAQQPSAQDSGAVELPPVSVSGPLATCDAPLGSCPAYSFAKGRPLLTAATFGAGSQFVAVGGDAVLIKLGDGSFRVARLPPVDSPPSLPATSWPLETDALTPIDVTESGYFGEEALHVLACAEAGAPCSVRRAKPGGVNLSAFHELAPLPANFRARKLSIGPTDEFGLSVLCSYGNGLLCLEHDQWREAIPISESLRLTHVANDAWLGLAVGDHGRWFMRGSTESGPTDWSEQAPLADVTLTHAAVHEKSGLVIGAGRVQAVIGTKQQEGLPCTPAGEIETAWIGWGAMTLQLASGALISHSVPGPIRKDADCLHDQLPAGAVLDSSSSPCGLSDNERYMLVDAVWGTNACPVE